MKKLLISLFSVLALWVPVSTFFILNDGANQAFKNLIGYEKKDLYKVDQRFASSMLLRFLENYYSYSQADNVEQKKNSLEKQLSPKIKNKTLRDFVEILRSNKISHLEQRAEVLKIQYSSLDNTFISYTKVNQKDLRAEEEKVIYLKSIISVDPTIKVSKISEHLIKPDSLEVLDKTISMNEGSYSKVILPCEIRSTSFDGKDSSIKRALLSDNKGLEFTPEGNVSSKSVFSVGCKNRRFKLALVGRDEFQTIFHKFEVSDSRLIERKLSKREKTKNSLEKQFGIKFDK